MQFLWFITPILVTVLTVPAQAAEWWHGTFVVEGQDASGCSDDGRVTYSEEGAEYRELSCSFEEKQKIRGMDAILLDERCEGLSGEPIEHRRVLLMVLSDESHLQSLAILPGIRASCASCDASRTKNMTKTNHLQPTRCHAHSKRTGLPCRNYAVRGWRVCRMHGARGGAPTGKKNGNYRHGGRTAQVREDRLLVRYLTSGWNDLMGRSSV